MDLLNTSNGMETNMVGLNSNNVPCISLELVQITEFTMKLFDLQMRCSSLTEAP